LVISVNRVPNTMQNPVFLNKINCLRIGIFIFPIIFIIITLPDSVIFESDDYSYTVFLIEDGPVENVTSFFYLLSSIFSILISIFFIKKEKQLFGFFYLFFAIGFIFIFFEEINWGERIFDVQHPDFFTSRGGEQLSLHNLPSVLHAKLEPIFFLVVSSFGSFAWALFYRLGKTKHNFFVRYFIPNWFLATYFFPILLWSAFYLSDLTITSPLDFVSEFIFFDLNKELFEFFTSAGILFFILSVFFRSKLDLKDIRPEKSKEKISIKRNLILITIIVIIIPTFTLIPIYLSDQYFVLTSLYGNDLSNFDLAGINLSGKDLTGTILTGANLSNAILTQANLTNVNLNNSNLSNAIILGAIMNDVNLENANLEGANLQGTYLINANLQGADLTRTKLSGVHLNNANLSGANLFNAKLNYVNLKGVTLNCVNHPICN